MKNVKSGYPAASSNVDRLLSLAEVCDILRVSPRTIYRFVDRSLLNPNRATRRLLFPASQIQRFIATGGQS